MDINPLIGPDALAFVGFIFGERGIIKELSELSAQGGLIVILFWVLARTVPQLIQSRDECHEVMLRQETEFAALAREVRALARQVRDRDRD